MATNPPHETAPDPDEDDLDDLDDVLDSFDLKPPHPTRATTSSSTAPTASGPGRPSDESAVVDDNDAAAELDFSKDLQAGMDNLISQLGEDPQMQKQFEDMMAELVAAGQAPTEKEAAEHIKTASESMPQIPEEVRQATAGGGGEEGKKGKDDGGNFQDTIRKTMERMQASGDAATAASTSGGEGASEDQMLAEMLKSLGAGGGEGGGLGTEDDFNSMIMSMMTQLTNKEILYEPMKELHDKFPAWMEAHKETEKKEDMDRFKEQQRLVGEIVARFERSGYTDTNEADREYIVERMQKMQAQGSPPPDLVGDMSAAQEALGNLDNDCPTQ